MVNNSVRDALHPHQWNIDLFGAVYETLHAFEVSLQTGSTGSSLERQPDPAGADVRWWSRRAAFPLLPPKQSPQEIRAGPSDQCSSVARLGSSSCLAIPQALGDSDCCRST